jgi:hypothetical protein
MNQRHLQIGLAVLLGLLMAAPAWGQMAVRPQRPVQNYDLSTVETIGGIIAEMKRISPKKEGAPVRLEMVLKTGQETVRVQLGPADYVGQQGVNLAPGDQVQVKGSRLSGPRHSFIVAAQVRKGDQVLQLRDDTGRPLWARGRQGF